MKLRITGTEAECAAALDALDVGFDVDEVSRFHPNRSGSGVGRVYVDAEPDINADAGGPRDRSEARLWVVGDPAAVNAVSAVVRSLLEVSILLVGGLDDGRMRLDLHVEWSGRDELVRRLRTWQALLDSNTDAEDGPSAGVAAPPAEAPATASGQANGATS